MQTGEKKRRNLLSIAVMLALTGITCYLLFHDQSFSNIGTALAGAKPEFLLAAFGMMLIFVWSESCIIRMLIRKSFQQNIGFFRSLAYSFVGFYFSSITPSATGGQPMQAYYMSRDGIKLAHSSFVLLVITSCYQIVVLMYGVIMSITHPQFISGQPPIIKWLLVLGIMGNGGAAFFFMLVVFNRKLAEQILMRGIAFLSRIHIIKNRRSAEQRVFENIEEYAKGGEYLKANRSIAVKTFLITVLQLTALFTVPYFVCLSLGIHTLSYGDFIALQAILSLCVTIVPLPGSVGASEGSFLSLYQGFISPQLLLPVMALSRGISFYSFLILSGIIVVGLHFCRKKQTNCPI